MEISDPVIKSSELKNYFLKSWELRVCVLFSLFLQIFLIVAGTFKRSSNKWIVVLLWLAYLLADIVAVSGLGLIVSIQSFYSMFCTRGFDFLCYDDHLRVYWAAFLLVHLGGPDFITSFAPEDNELWRRHLFYLASQCTTVAYCFYQTETDQPGNQLRIPMILVLLSGIIKCSERICALYYGSASSFRSYNFSENRAKSLIRMNGDALSQLQVMQYAFVYFTTFKGLVVDLTLKSHERNQSREFFLATSCKEAFRIVEVELKYIYDALFTKLPVLHHKFGYCSRTLSFIAVVSSFMVFHFGVKNELFIWTDVVITYILLTGAIVLDMIQFFMLFFCDWTVVKLCRPPFDANAKRKSWKHKFVDWILCVKNTKNMFLHWLLGLVRERDHHCVSEFTDSRLLKEIWYVKPQPLTHYLINFIFNELKMKSQMADSLAMAKQICSSKGEWVLREIEGLDTFLPFVVDNNYDNILLLWHIATEVCYNDPQDQVTGNLKQRDTAKQLSDYMLYLMVMKPDRMSAVSSTGKIKFQDTCIEVSKLFDTKLSELEKKRCCFFGRESGKEEALHTKACQTILSINSEVKAGPGHNDEYKLLLFDASVLAKELNLLPSEKKWLMISKLWVELLSYAASHIRSSAHAQQLNEGGELITVVWLLMAHFGLGDQYEISPGMEGEG